MKSCCSYCANGCRVYEWTVRNSKSVSSPRLIDDEPPAPTICIEHYPIYNWTTINKICDLFTESKRARNTSATSRQLSVHVDVIVAQSLLFSNLLTINESNYLLCLGIVATHTHTEPCTPKHMCVFCLCARRTTLAAIKSTQRWWRNFHLFFAAIFRPIIIFATNLIALRTNTAPTADSRLMSLLTGSRQETPRNWISRRLSQHKHMLSYQLIAVG